MTSRELAIARSVIYASLFDYPLTVEQLHRTLIESDQTPSEILAVYDGSEPLHRIIDYRDGFFFPIGRDDLIVERRRREARSRRFLTQHHLLLRLICALPFTRLVALSGSIAHLNMDADGDLDLFIVTRGRRVWTVVLAVLVLAKLLRRRRVVCANFVLADTRLSLDQQDLFTANQVVHLLPIDGHHMFDALLAANPFVARFYPNGAAPRPQTPLPLPAMPVLHAIKTCLEFVLWAPSPILEGVCRRLYAWHLRRRAASWRSPDQVQLQSDYLKLHTQSHRHVVVERFDAAMTQAFDRANGVTLTDMVRAPRPPQHDDLFVIFPDLPGIRLRTAAEQVERLQLGVEEMRQRAHANIARQRAATERVRAALNARRRR
jgi:hypothetical protein